jgi:CheY-like chemotaxis protein
MKPIPEGEREGHQMPMTQPAKRILLIDDNEDLLALLQLSLLKLGFEVVTAASGSKGLEILTDRQVDLVIVDYKMPDMDGGVVTQEIRRIQPLTPIMMYSAALEEVPAKVLELVDEFISKQEPFSNLVYHLAKVAVRPNRPRRALPRYPVRTSFLVIDEVPANAVSYGESSDLSEGGMGGLLEQKLDLPLQRVVLLRVTLSAENALTMRASLRYRAGARHGFQFLDLTAAQLRMIRSSLSS